MNSCLQIYSYSSKKSILTRLLFHKLPTLFNIYEDHREINEFDDSVFKEGMTYYVNVMSGFENENIFIKNEEENKVIEINNEIRNADYKYIYGDRNSLQVKKIRAKEMFEVLASILKIFPEIKDNVDALETFKFVLEQYGFDNFERFKKNELLKDIN